MLHTVFLYIWRVIVFAIGALATWFFIFEVYPYADSRMPAYIAVLALYCVFAYVIIPALVRLQQVFIKPNHLPHYAVSHDGWSSDPINIAVICKDQTHLERAMTKAGWHKADKATVKNILREGYALLLKKPYDTAPVSNLYLLGRKHDVAFQIQTGPNPSPRHRHHIRFWRLTAPDSSTEHGTFWHTMLALFRRKKREIWVAAATHDVAPIAFRMQNLQVTHQIDEDTNKERDYVIQTLTECKAIRNIDTVTTGEPFSFKGQTFGVRIVVDGQLKVVELKTHTILRS